MSIPEKLAQEIKAAMLAKNADRLSTLRMLKAAVGYAQIELKTESLTEAQWVAIIQKEVKKRRDAFEQFDKGGRPELAAKEKAEAATLEEFLPAQLSEADLGVIIQKTIQELGATSKKEMGSVIKAVQAKVAGSADGKAISSAVAKLLP